MTTLSISIVTYRPDMALLSGTIKSLVESIDYARTMGLISRADLALIDNSTTPWIHDSLAGMLDEFWNKPGNKSQLVTTDRNIGYGMAHNLAIAESGMDFYLVLNPDVFIDKHALTNALQFMHNNRGVALLTPSVTDSEGNREYLNKRYPSVLVLLIRGFAPAPVKKLFINTIAHYEMQEMDPDEVNYNVQLASGCFMLFRTTQMQQLGGFSDRFFLYFEDYDLSMRTRENGSIAYVPGVRIVHYGGNAARKGIRHVFLFIRSAITFFSLYGWKW